MSLVRELWLALLVMTSTLFAGTVIFTFVSDYQLLRQQLSVKNMDNAAALALSMSQMEKDHISMELIASAQFDTGHYELIRLKNAQGEVLTEITSPAGIVDVPGWFLALVQFDIPSGSAVIQDGWSQYGSIELRSHPGYAYVALWDVTVKLSFWFASMLLVSGFIGSYMLRYILRPMHGVIAQAEALGERRFLKTGEPRTLEFRRLVQSMNSLTDRMAEMLRAESRRIDQWRRMSQTDTLTGLHNRETFLRLLGNAISSGDQGVLIMLRLPELETYNLLLGHKAVDALLQELAQELKQHCRGRAHRCVVARTGSSEFTIMAEAESSTTELAAELLKKLGPVLRKAVPEPPTEFLCGACTVGARNTCSELMSRVDCAVALSATSGQIGVVDDDAMLTLAAGIDWRMQIDAALRAGHLRYQHLPVRSRHRGVVHREVFVKIKIQERWLWLGEVVPWVWRLGMSSQLDVQLVRSAIEQLCTSDGIFALQLSADSLTDPMFCDTLLGLLRQHPAAARQLCLEWPEFGALHLLPEFKLMCARVKPHVAQIGLKYAGFDLPALGDLHDVGLDHIKLDASLIEDLNQRQETQAFIHGVCTMAHTVGIQVLTGGVNTKYVLQLLWDIGVDGFSGPATGTIPTGPGPAR